MEELGLVKLMVEKEVIWEVCQVTMVMIGNKCHYFLKVEHDTSMSALEDSMEPCLSELSYPVTKFLLYRVY